METSTDPQTKTLGQAVRTALTAAAASQGHATKPSTGSDEHRRAFVETFKRWDILFKRKDSGNVENEKWLMAEYYDSLGHLTPAGFDKLTDILKETCIFFPTIRECLEAITCKDRYDWGHPFRGDPPALVSRAVPTPRLAAAAKQIEYRDE